MLVHTGIWVGTVAEQDPVPPTSVRRERENSLPEVFVLRDGGRDNRPAAEQSTVKLSGIVSAVCERDASNEKDDSTESGNASEDEEE